MKTQAHRATKPSVQPVAAKAPTVVLIRPGSDPAGLATTLTTSSNDGTDLETSHRANAMTTTLKDILAHMDPPVQHWGINE